MAQFMIDRAAVFRHLAEFFNGSKLADSGHHPRMLSMNLCKRSSPRSNSFIEVA
jgi:hypothetical protein